MNETVAMPFVLVVLVPDENEPPDPVLLQVTTFPAMGTGRPPASANCAVMVTAVPATGLLSLEVTTYFAGWLATTSVAPVDALLPWQLPPAFAVTVKLYVPGTIAVVVPTVSSEFIWAPVDENELGVNVAVAPAGRPEALRVTEQVLLLPLNVTLTELAAVLP